MHNDDSRGAGGNGLPGRFRLRLAGAAFALLVVALSTTLRIAVALGDPHFDTQSPTGLLRTDPALLYYVTEKIIEAEGGVPWDFRADPRIQYPDGADIPAMFTVGQEFLVAWTWLGFGQDVPLHVWAVCVMALWASLTGLAVYGLARELTGRVGWACLATALWAVLLANYRTLGFILIREDFALPWLALHLFLLARAARVRTPVAFGLAGVAMTAAAATWHAMSFVLALEAGCFGLWFLRTGRNPLAARWAWLVPAVPGMASFAIPVLAAKGFVLSLPMLMAGALAAGALAARGGRLSRRGETGVVVGAGLLAVLASRLPVFRSGSGASDYAHVFELIGAKLRYLGALPADPQQLSFGARLLWDGPFDTASITVLFVGLSTGLVATLAALTTYARDWWRGEGEPAECLLVAFGAFTLLSAVLIERVYVVVGILAPVIAAVYLAGVRPPRTGLSAMFALIGLAGVLQMGAFIDWENDWYPPTRVAERAHVLRWIGENIRNAEPIASDFVTSPAVLAHSGHPILQQPKYETARSRDRIQGFFETFFQGTPEDLHRSILDAGARYLVVDRVLLKGHAYIGGVPQGASPRAGTAAAYFLSDRPGESLRVPGFELIYRSPKGMGTDSYRVYRLQ